MANLSITAAWNETASFVKNNAGTLFTVALAMIALPSVIMQAAAPTAGASPGEMPTLMLMMLPVVIVLSTVGTIAIAALALGRENVVGAAIAHGFRRFLPLIGASLLIGLAFLLLAVPLALAFGLDFETLGSPQPDLGGGFVLAFFVLLLLLMVVWVRLMLMTPIAAAEKEGPIGIIRRSWNLTAGHFWKLFGFVLLFAIAAGVLMLVVSVVIGLVIAAIAGDPGEGGLAAILMALLGGVVNAIFVVYFTTIIARIYRQLAGDGTDAAAAFE